MVMISIAELQRRGMTGPITEVREFDILVARGGKRAGT